MTRAEALRWAGSRRRIPKQVIVVFDTDGWPAMAWPATKQGRHNARESVIRWNASFPKKARFMATCPVANVEEHNNGWLPVARAATPTAPEGKT